MSNTPNIEDIITMQDVYDARDAMKNSGIIETELYDSDNLQAVTGCKLFLKLELQQRCRSFKSRGAYNKIRKLKQGSIVCTVSSGNHSQGVAYAAQKCHCKAKIYMAQTASPDKISATKAYGAEVVLKGNNFEEAHQALKEDREKNPEWIYVSPYDDADVIAGNATLGLEIFEQCKEANLDLKTVVVPVGGGGLISGVSFALKQLKPDIRIVGVQMKSSPYVYNAWCRYKGLSKDIVEKESRTPLADGIAIKHPGELNMPFIYKYVDDFVIVKEDDVARAVSLLAERGKLISEGAGAAAFSSILTKKINVDENEAVVAIVSGGNISLQMLARCIDRALFLNGTRKSLQVILPYGTNYIYQMTQVIVNNHAEILSCENLSHVDTVANKEHYSVVIDIANPSSMDAIKEEFEKRRWHLVIETTEYYDD